MQTRPPSRPSQRAKEVSRRVNERPQGRKEIWHAVSILTSTTTCEAASALRNHRFLSKDAPKLPLSAVPRRRVVAAFTAITPIGAASHDAPPTGANHRGPTATQSVAAGADVGAMTSRL